MILADNETKVDLDFPNSAALRQDRNLLLPLNLYF
jgi:hypothetical protein